MKLDRVSHIPYSQRVGRYHFQMVQAKLGAPVEPIFGYSLQPYYTRQQQWMADLSDSLSRLYRFFADLDNAAREFDPSRPNSAINQRAVAFSAPEAAAVQADSQAASGTHRLRIVSLASGQSHTSKALPGDAPTVVLEGPQQFVLRMGEQEELFSYDSQASDSHADSLRSIAEALRGSSLGLDARIVSEGQSIALTVSSRQSGAAAAFELWDVTGNTVRSLGLDRVTQKASDAVYLWDGVQHTSPSNRVTLSDGAVQLSLRQAGENEIAITISPDMEQLLRHTRTLVNGYNRLHAFLAEQSPVLATQKLDTFTRMAQASGGALGNYGLRVQSDGQIALDESAWRAAVSANFPGFAKEMAGLSRSFREEVIRVQSKPFASFSRSYEAATSANPYEQTTASGMQFRFATRTGLFFNQLW
ncbi:flagellar filament capping protein FliD [Brevibacillus agri]